MSSRLSAAAGAAIRRLRQGKGWTLAELSTRSGVPLSSLSKVELGQTSLAYDVLIRVCRALEVEVDHLVRPESLPSPPRARSGRRSVVRAGEGEPRRLGGHAASIGATDLLQRDITPVVLEICETRRNGSLMRARGDAYLRVLSGAVVMHSEVYAPLALQPGDAVFFDGEMGFALTAPDGQPSQVLLIHQGDRLLEA